MSIVDGDIDDGISWAATPPASNPLAPPAAGSPYHGHVTLSGVDTSSDSEQSPASSKDDDDGAAMQTVSRSANHTGANSPGGLPSPRVSFRVVPGRRTSFATPVGDDVDEGGKAPLSPVSPRSSGMQLIACLQTTQEEEEEAYVDSGARRRRREMLVTLRHSSFFLLSGENPVRQFVLFLVNSRGFEAFIILTIAVNCVLLALDDPTSPVDAPYTAITELMFACIFSAEMVLKLVAMGLVAHPGAYLRDPWNVFDGAIVVLTWLNYAPGVGNFTALRTFRVLRPLRSVNAIPGLKSLVTTLVKIFRVLASVALLTMFLYIVFGIVGVQLWQGTFQYQCVSVAGNASQAPMATPNNATADNGHGRAWRLLSESADVDPRAAGSVTTVYGCSPTAVPPYWGSACPEGTVCTSVGNPGFGIHSFDNIWSAWLIFFQCMTLEGWPAVMLRTYNGFGVISFPIFVFLIVFGSYFVPNLALAVVSNKYIAEYAKVAARNREEARRRDEVQRRRESIVDLVRTVRRLSLTVLDDAGDQPSAAVSLARGAAAAEPDVAATAAEPDAAAGAAVARRRVLRPVFSDRATQGGTVTVSTARADGYVSSKGPPEGGAYDDDNVAMHYFPSLDAVPLLLRIRDRLHLATQGYPLLLLHAGAGLAKEARGGHRDVDGAVVDSIEASIFLRGHGAPSHTAIPTVSRHITPFMVFIMVCIGLNTVLLASQHYGQPGWLTELVDDANYGFTAIFTIELLMTMLAVGPTRFFRSGFNVMDLIIVVLAIVEFVFLESNIVTAFRALRLLRIMKLVKSFPTLRSLVVAIVLSLTETLYLAVITGLLVFVAALSGMQFFGGRFGAFQPGTTSTALVDGYGPVRFNYDTFLRSFFTVFQVLTTDQWVDIMWVSMVSTSPAAAIFYIVIILFGTYSLVSLFTSILINGFRRMSRSTVDDENDDGVPGGADEEDFGDPEGRMLAEALESRIMDLKTERAVIVHEAASPLFASPVASPRASPQTFDLMAVMPDGGSQGFLRVLELAREQGYQVDPADSSIAEPLEALPRCSKCGTSPAEPLPPDPHMRDPPTEEQLHQLHCAVAKLRQRKMIAAQGLLHLCAFKCGLLRGDSNGRISPSAAAAASRAPASRPSVTDDGTEAKPVVECPAVTPPATQSPMSAPWPAPNRWAEDRFAVINEAHERGILRLVSPFDDDQGAEVSEVDGWTWLSAELREQIAVLELALGEEQIGGAAAIVAVCDTAPVTAEEIDAHETSLFCFGPENAFRVGCQTLERSRAFTVFIGLCVLVSTVLLVFDSPLDDPHSSTQQVLHAMEIVFTAVFCFEMVLKIIADGLVLHPSAYFRDFWNVLDAFIVAVSIFSLLIEADGFASVAALRALHAVRPLRAIRRYRGLRLVFLTLLKSLTGIMHVGMLVAVIFTIFGVLAVQLFGGRFRSCTDPTVTLRAECIGSFIVDAAANRTEPRLWLNDPRNFDHMGNALVTLFQIASGDNWGDVMNLGIDAVSDSVAPQREFRPWMGLFFVGFFIVSNFFLLNIFIGVLIFHFTDVKAKLDGVSLMTEDQKMWVEAQRFMLHFTPKAQLTALDNAASRRIASWVAHPAFEIGSAVLVFLNVVVLSMDYYGANQQWEDMLLGFNVFFVVVFVIEAAVKLAAFGAGYFQSGWNRFDFVIMVIGVAGLVIGEFVGQFANGGAGAFAVIRVVRILRIGRAIPLVKRARQVQVLLETLWYSLPSIVNVSIFILLVYFIFASVCFQLFARVKTGRVIDDNFFNFRTFWTSMQMMFIFTTNELWSDAMYDCSVQPPQCTPAAVAGDHAAAFSDCGTPFAPVIFITFAVVSAFVVSNLFVAIILDNFDTTLRIDRSIVTMKDLHRFTDVWSLMNPSGSLMMDTNRLPELLARVQPPLGISRKYSRIEIFHKLGRFAIPDHHGMVHFIETLIPLSRAVLRVEMSEAEERRQQAMWQTAFPELEDLPTIRFRERPAHVGQVFAATFIAGAYRRAVAMRWLEDQRRQCSSPRAMPKVDFVELRQHLRRSRRAIDADDDDAGDAGFGHVGSFKLLPVAMQIDARTGATGGECR